MSGGKADLLTLARFLLMRELPKELINASHLVVTVASSVFRSATKAPSRSSWSAFSSAAAVNMSPLADISSPVSRRICSNSKRSC